MREPRNTSSIESPGALGQLGSRQAFEVGTGVLTTARMLLRPLMAEDRGAFVAAVRASRAELDRLHPLHVSGESDDELFDRQLQLSREGERRGAAWRRVGVLESGEIVGAFNINAIVRGLTFEGEAAWWVRSDRTGRGLATEGVRAMFAYALSDMPSGLGLHTLHAMIEPANAASRRIAEKLGLAREANVTAKVRFPDGWHTHDVFRVTVESFRTSAA